MVLEFRRYVEQLGLDDHAACTNVPHTRRAATLLRFLRARSWNLQKAAALLGDALDWRRDFQIEQKLAAWRREWEAQTSERVRLFQTYDFVDCLGQDKEGLPVYVHRFSQGDPGGLARELGEEVLLLRFLQVVEDSFEQSQRRILETGRLLTNFVEVYDMGNYGLVQRWFQRAMAAVGPYKRFGPILDKVYPERVRASFILRAPPAFAVVWRIMAPLLPEATKKKIRIRGFHARAWLAELEEFMPEGSIPPWLRSEEPAHLCQAKPYGGIVPSAAKGGGQTAPEAEAS